MKKSLIALVLLTATISSLPLMAQTDTVKVDTTQVDEIEVYSDTTQNDTASVIAEPVDADDDNFPFGSSNGFDNVIESIGDSSLGFGVMLFVLGVLFIIFVVSPIAIIGLILWFVNRNRKERLRLAEMAMKNGQPIPDEVANPLKPETNNEVWERGVRQTFLGIGLTALGLWIGKLGIVLGLLVLCIGLGNLFISRNGRRSPWGGDDQTGTDKGEQPQSREDIFRDLTTQDEQPL